MGTFTTRYRKLIMLDINSLVRDKKKVLSTVEVINGEMVTKTGCKIYIPVRYTDKKLSSVGKEVKTAAIFAMVIDDKFYSVCNVCSALVLTPTFTTITKFGDDEYYEFVFEAGATIAPTLESEKNSGLVYRIYDDLIARAHIPWYLNHQDTGKILLYAAKHGGIWLAANNVPVELLISIIARNSKDVTKHFRHTVTTFDDILNHPPVYVPIGSVILGAKNTVSALMGSRIEDGMIASLVSPSTETSIVETILRL